MLGVWINQLEAKYWFAYAVLLTNQTILHCVDDVPIHPYANYELIILIADRISVGECVVKDYENYLNHVNGTKRMYLLLWNVGISIVGC